MSSKTSQNPISDLTKCKFPFEYQGKVYSTCDTPDNWCATKVDSKGKYVTGFHGYCNTSKSPREQCYGAPTGKYRPKRCLFYKNFELD